MYRLVPFIDLGLFNELKMPLHKCFLADFEKWHKQNNYPIGQQLYIYDSYMNEINLILSRELPKISVAKYQGDKY